MTRILTYLILLNILTSCQTKETNPILLSKIQAFAPLNGSSIGIAYMNIKNTSDQSITLNQQIIIDSETIQSVTLDLPPSIIADDMQLIIQLDSFTFGRSPYIDDITLTW